MLARIPLPSLSARLAITAALCGTLGTAPAAAQDRDARLPEQGRLWLEVSPVLLNWTEQYALDSPAGIADGEREPLFRDFDGPIASRLFPGPAPYIADLNADAGALGFDPYDEQSFSLGALDFSTMNAQIRRLNAGFELGVFDRLAIGVNAPLAFAEVEPAFAYDSAGATVTSASLAFSGGNAFLGDARSSIDSLDELIAGGTLMGPALTDAMALRADADAFLSALERRTMAGLLVPTGSSTAGMQMISKVDGFVTSFEAFGLSHPALALPATASRADVPLLFEGDPISGLAPGQSSAGLMLGEVEISVRIGLLDGITPRERDTRPDTEPADPSMPDSAAPDSSAARAGQAAPGQVASAGADSSTAERGPSDSADAAATPFLRFRTAVGGLVRVPAGDPSLPPFADPADFFFAPIADGQMDVELTLYQDIALGGWGLLRAMARYGIQMADEVVLRVHPPDRPYAFASTQGLVRRDLGDYLEIVVRPSIRLNSAMRVELVYGYWQLGEASYTLLEELSDVADAGPLAIESRQTRQTVGLGLTYDLTSSQGRDELVEDRVSVHPPWRFTIGLRRSIGGSGGQTPARLRYAASFRIPIRIF